MQKVKQTEKMTPQEAKAEAAVGAEEPLLRWGQKTMFSQWRQKKDKLEEPAAAAAAAGEDGVGGEESNLEAAAAAGTACAMGEDVGRAWKCKLFLMT